MLAGPADEVNDLGSGPLTWELEQSFRFTLLNHLHVWLPRVTFRDMTGRQRWKCYLGLHDYVQDRPDRPRGGPPPRTQICRRCGKKRDPDALMRGAPWVGGP